MTYVSGRGWIARKNANGEINDEDLIFYAAEHNNPSDIMHSLLFHEIDVETRSQALYTAAKHNHGNSHFITIELLLKAGAKTNIHNALREVINRTTKVEMVQLFLDHRFDVNFRGIWGNTPLFKAISCGNLKVARHLLDHGADVNLANCYEETPLHQACVYRGRNAYVKDIKFLIKNGARLDLLDNAIPWGGIHGDRRTPLMTLLSSSPSVISRNFEKALKYMLKYSDVNGTNLKGRNVLQFCGKEEFLKIILERIAIVQSLDLYVNPSLYKTISLKKNCGDYFKKCLEELTVAKSTKLKNCWVTFFNLLVDSRRKLKNYAGNQDLIRAFNKSRCREFFRIYGAQMEKNVKKGIARRKLYDRSAEILSKKLKIFNPTHLIVRDILDCLKNSDFLKLCGKN